MASLDTNFNVTPYFDDYDEDKNFHRILFRPAVPIQARELTQLQTILQNQVERFGDNIYKQGTIIKGCTFSYDYNYSYIKINDLKVDGLPALPSDYANLYAVDTSSNLQAIIVNAVNGLESQDPVTNLLYVKYLNTGSNQKKTFANSETITLYNQDYRLTDVTISSGGTLYDNSDFLIFTGDNGAGAEANVITYSNGTIKAITFSAFGNGYITAPTITVNTTTGSSANLIAINYEAQVTVCNSSFSANSNTTGTSVSTDPVGTGTAVTISDGIIYQKGHFVRVEQQTIIVDNFSRTPNNVVLGFYTEESIVNNSLDSTLLDNAQGYSNYTAPGANRLKLTPQLQVLSKEAAAANTEFFKIIEFENGSVSKRKTETEFNSIDKKLAQRTAEESGDYVVHPFVINSEEIVGNTTHLKAVISAGVGYVDGERVELNDSIRLNVRQGTDTRTGMQQSIVTNYGNYVIANQVHGVFGFTAGDTVNLRNIVATDVTDNIGGASTSPGSIIGTAKIRSVEYHSGTVGTPSCQYRLYLFDIVMSSSNKFSSVRSVQKSGAVADVVFPSYSRLALQDTTYDTLVFQTGYSAVSAISNADFIYRTVTSNSFSTSGNTTIQLSGTYDYFPYTAGSTLNTVQEQDFIIIPTVNAVSTANLTGSATTTGNVVTGTGTSFATALEVGDYIKFSSGSAAIVRVTSITNATSMTLSSAISASGNVSLAYPANIPVRMDRVGASITIGAQGNTATISLGSGIAASAAVSVIHNVKVSPGSNIIHKAKTVVKDVYIKLSTTSITANNKGPWSLGIPDVYNLKGVYIGTGNTYSNTTTNYASSFQLIDGQTDNIYGLSQLKLKPGSTISITNSNCLLVRVDLFTHGSGYYISTNSYPVDDATSTLPANKIRTYQIPSFLSPKTGSVTSLRDVVDFRPIVASTANTGAVTVAAATIDPSNTHTLTGSVYFPAPNEVFEADITYFMPRADRIIVDKNGNFYVKEGLPSNNPVPSIIPDKSMSLGTLLVPPFPSLSPKTAATAQRPHYATLVKTDQVKRYTMKDIRQIEDRLASLEYYSLLNTLEKNTKDLIIPSEANTAVSRFKNGFFVDPMNNYDIANPNDYEFNFLIDFDKSHGRPTIEEKKIDLAINTSSSTSYSKTGDYAALSYTHDVAFAQYLASKSRTVASLAWSYRGVMRLFPEYDNYYDLTNKATSFTFDLSKQFANFAKSINDSVVFKGNAKTVTVNNSDWAAISGTYTGAAQQSDVVVANAGILKQDQQAVKTTVTNTTTGSIVPGQTVQTSQTIGDFVTKFDFNPFIRAQQVEFVVVGLRPGARHYVFFDQKPVESRPGQVVSMADLTGGTEGLSESTNFSFTGPVGADLVANSTGGLAGAFFIPGNTFNVGQREVLIVDTDDIESADSAVSKATSPYNAYNFTKEMTNVTMVTKAPASFDVVYNRTTVVERENIRRTYAWDPLAQTFNINFNDGTDGCFLTKIDLYFKGKSNTTGITVQLRETDNGYPAPTILATKILSSSDVNVSDNAQAPTTVTFDTPVFIRNNKDYCVALLPELNSPDYVVWTSVPGQPDVFSNKIDNGDFGMGVLFISSNDKVWTPVQTEDLKFTTYYAKYASTSGTVVLENRNYEFLTLSNTVGAFEGGEMVAQKSNSYITSANLTVASNNAYGLQRVFTSSSLTSTLTSGDNVLMVFGTDKALKTGTVSNSAPTTITGTGTDFVAEYDVGDYLLIGNSVREITAIANTTQLTIEAPLASSASGVAHYGVTESFQVNKVLLVSPSFVIFRDYCESTADGSTTYMNMQKTVTARVSEIGNDDTILLDNSTAANTSFLFEATKTIVGSKSDAVAVISSVDDYAYNFLEPHISTITPSSTDIRISQNVATTSGSYSTQDIGFGVSNKNNNESEIRSRSNEILNYSGAKSLQITATLGRPSTSDKVSPVIDLSPVSVVLLKNKINNSSANENTKYGNASVKYISKRIVLADGLDAEDMKFYVTAYKPAGTSVLVYAKILSNDDGGQFDSKDWTLLDQTTEASLFSDLADEGDYLEYEYSLPKTPPATRVTGVAGTNANNTLSGFSTTFDTDFIAGDLIKIVNTDTQADYEINVVGTVTNSTSIELVSNTGPYSNTTTTGLTVEKVTQPLAAFKYWADSSVVQYYDTSRSAYSTYKIFAIKVVLLSDNTQNVPKIKDIRALAVSV
jgi:hypothetical protein